MRGRLGDINVQPRVATATPEFDVQESSSSVEEYIYMLAHAASFIFKAVGPLCFLVVAASIGPGLEADIFQLHNSDLEAAVPIISLEFEWIKRFGLQVPAGFESLANFPDNLVQLDETLLPFSQGSGSDSPLLSALAGKRGLTVQLTALWVSSEACFFAACHAMSWWMTVAPTPYPVATAEKRAEVWSRIVSDPTISPDELGASWFYREADLASAPPSLFILLSTAVRLLSTALSVHLPRSTTFTVTGEEHIATRPRDATKPAAPLKWEDLKRGDLAAWMAWELYDRPLHRFDATERAELEGQVKMLEAAAGSELAGDIDATTPGIRFMAAIKDPISWEHRPLAYYAVTHGFYGNILTRDRYAQEGYSPQSHEQLRFFFRPADPAANARLGRGVRVVTRTVRRVQSTLSQRIAVATPGVAVASTVDVPVGARPGDRLPEAMDGRGSGTSTPSVDDVGVEALVFIHGVGVGPLPYISLIEGLSDSLTPVLVLEMPAFSQRVDPFAPPPPEIFATQLEGALLERGVSKARVVGHSLGTAYASYFAKYKPKRIASLTLIDPIAINLHHATVTSAFIYSPVMSCRDAAEEYFVRRELFTANIIARHLAWFDADFWAQDCAPSSPTLVILSENDRIVPVTSVRKQMGSWQARARGVRVLLLPEIGHGGWLASPDSMKRIVSSIRRLQR